MGMPRTMQSDYVQFLRNPQTHGVWSITIQPDETSAGALRSLLTLGRFAFMPYRYGRMGEEEPTETPAILTPRLFAYLRSLSSTNASQSRPLFAFEREFWGKQRAYSRSQMWIRHCWEEVGREPRKISPDKKRRLAKSLSVFKRHFQNCTMEPVPERPSALDVVSPEKSLYFQVQESGDGRISILALQEQTCESVTALYAGIPGLNLELERRKVFSPETELLSMYMPSLRLSTPSRILHDAAVVTTISQTLSEVKESRFTHAIRALGIGAEELVVEVYETYLHEKAPEAPLGVLLAVLNTRIQEVQSGLRAKPVNAVSKLKRTLGGVIAAEKKKPSRNPELCTVCEVILQGVLPLVEKVSDDVAGLEEPSANVQKTIIFPAYVNQSLSDLVSLRNRVSHRVDRLGSARTVTYLDSALALKSYIALALWWQEERKQIDYRIGLKEAIKKAVERNKVDTLT